VFPASIAATSLAFNNGAVPRYDPATGTCATYCHGAGTSMPTDAGIQNPRWLGGPLVCGTSCHALPPNDGNFGHTAAAAPRICADCHGATIAVDGGLLFVYQPDGGLYSNHLDGRVTASQQ
jgi:predicted CxxxxCH...CXXCH cytochrome family protein